MHCSTIRLTSTKHDMAQSGMKVSVCTYLPLCCCCLLLELEWQIQVHFITSKVFQTNASSTYTYETSCKRATLLKRTTCLNSGVESEATSKNGVVFRLLPVFEKPSYFGIELHE
jgi:hypothetical protein